MIKWCSIILLAAVVGGCNYESTDKEVDSPDLKTVEISDQNVKSPDLPRNKIATFLTFQNNDAEEAMNFYVSLFDNSRVIEVEHHSPDGPAKEGSILKATFELNGIPFICSDSYIKHEWNFTPGVSIWVDCESEEELNYLFDNLSKDGAVMMPLDNYGFSYKFGFVADRFGVSWQLNLQDPKQ